MGSNFICDLKQHSVFLLETIFIKKKLGNKKRPFFFFDWKKSEVGKASPKGYSFDNLKIFYHECMHSEFNSSSF